MEYLPSSGYLPLRLRVCRCEEFVVLGRFLATMLRLLSVCDVCIVVKRCVLEQITTDNQ